MPKSEIEMRLALPVPLAADDADDTVGKRPATQRPSDTAAAHATYPPQSIRSREGVDQR